jgi:hypothetical protein
VSAGWIDEVRVGDCLLLQEIRAVVQEVARDKSWVT